MRASKVQPSVLTTDNVLRPLVFRADDESLVSAVRNGESDARRQFFERHAPYVGRLLMRILGPETEVADLIQDVFLMALRDIDRLRDPHALRSWLGSIAVHIARGHLRHRKRRRWLLEGRALLPIFFAAPVDGSPAGVTPARR